MTADKMSPDKLSDKLSESSGDDTVFQPSRRLFLKGTAAAGAGLVIGFQIGCAPSQKQPETPAPGPTPDPTPGPAPDPAPAFAPNAFLRIAPDGTVTVVSKHIEFGQGTYTGLATILAEELDADWSKIRVESAPADAKRYNNFTFGPIQGTGGSSAMSNSWQQLREAGATGRALLVAAAAATWQVPAGEITVQRGQVMHAASRRSAGFGELVARAATLPVPDSVKLKDPKEFTLIGTDMPRVDVTSKTDGSARFTLDVYLPDMLTAVIARPPRFGGKVKRFDASAAKAVNGVVDAVQIPRGVAVVGRSFWAAKKGRDALQIEWDDSEAETRSTNEMWQALRELAKNKGAVAVEKGDAAKGIATAKKVVEAEFEVPFLAHATMEPLDCVVQIQGSGGDARCKVWLGSQIQTMDQGAAAAILGIGPDRVEVETLLAGGSFGRRGTFDGEVVAEAVSIAKALGTSAPVKLVWTREDDIRGGRYRPMFLHRIRAGLDAKGAITGWEHRIVGPSIFAGTPLEQMGVRNGVDGTSVEGAAPPPYDIANLYVDAHNAKIGVPVHFWRSVGSTHTAFAIEVFIDQIAAALERDPVELRRALLSHHPRHLAVLDLAAEKSNWKSPLPRGKARGFAIHESFNTVVAEVAEISLAADGMPKVERVVCAVDCGIAINPDNIRAQVEGGLGYGLGAALHNEILIDKGVPVQSNFHDYRPLRIHEMPAIEVHIVPSANPPTGIGEPGLPPIAPAVANAYFRLTGKKLHRLPFRRSLA
jgi:isoquinoline 1-oxidoreductase beta subunit